MTRRIEYVLAHDCRDCGRKITEKEGERYWYAREGFAYLVMVCSQCIEQSIQAWAAIGIRRLDRADSVSLGQMPCQKIEALWND